MNIKLHWVEPYRLMKVSWYVLLGLTSTIEELCMLIMFLQERKSIRPTFSAEGIYGGTLLAVRTNEFICFYDWAECRVVRRIDVVVKVIALQMTVKTLHSVAVILFDFEVEFY